MHAVAACGKPTSLCALHMRLPPAEKHAAENKNRPTSIICKHFLEAVEKVGLGYSVAHSWQKKA